MAERSSFRRTRRGLDCDGQSGLSRRDFAKAGLFSFLGLSLLDLLKVDALAEGGGGTCDAVILVWLAGGPSHIDTFDPKPGEASGGPLKAIATKADGIQICEHLPTVARNMHLAALLRSLTSKEGSHERATYEMHTGYKPLASVTHPSLGSLVVHEKGRKNAELPAFVHIGQNAFGAGFLGSQVAPFLIGDPNNPMRNLTCAKEIEQARFQQRVGLLHDLDRPFSSEMRDPEVAEYGIQFNGATELMRAKSVEAFDLSKEDPKRLQRYGENGFAKSMVIAKRLVEAGVRFVEVTLGGWDNHNDCFKRVPELCATLDPALGNLLEDLNASGLLKRTLVLCTGEFGRTPAINAQGGRDHYPRVWSGLLAGGGIKPGFVYGSSDKQGAEVKEHPVSPGDLHATVFELLGVNHSKENYTPEGRPIRVVDKGAPVKGLMA